MNSLLTYYHDSVAPGDAMVCVLSQRHFTLRIAPEAGSSLHQQQPCVVVAHIVPIVCPGLLGPAERETAARSATAGPLYSAAQPARPQDRMEQAAPPPVGGAATDGVRGYLHSGPRSFFQGLGLSPLGSCPIQSCEKQWSPQHISSGPRQTLVLAEEPLRKEGFQALRSQGSVAASHPPAPPELQLS